jgi:hypothetical protein
LAYIVDLRRSPQEFEERILQTEDLIELLVEGPRAPSRAAVSNRLGAGFAISVVAAVLTLMILLDGRAHLATLSITPTFWAKVALPLSIATVAISLVSRLSRPGVRVGPLWIAVVVPIAITWVAAIVTLITTPLEARAELLLGHTWRTCSLNIALLSVPPFVAMIWAMRGLAPTRPQLVGAVVGLLAGAIGASVYCLRCPETSPPFWATWYVVGMAVPTIAGSLLGKRALRW